jgi:hypothetical protein
MDCPKLPRSPPLSIRKRLFCAAYSNDVVTLQQLSRLDIATATEYDEAVLEAAKKNHIEAFDYLLKEQADIRSVEKIYEYDSDDDLCDQCIERKLKRRPPQLASPVDALVSAFLNGRIQLMRVWRRHTTDLPLVRWLSCLVCLNGDEDDETPPLAFPRVVDSNLVDDKVCYLASLRELLSWEEVSAVPEFRNALLAQELFLILRRYEQCCNTGPTTTCVDDARIYFAQADSLVNYTQGVLVSLRHFAYALSADDGTMCFRMLLDTYNSNDTESHPIYVDLMKMACESRRASVALIRDMMDECEEELTILSYQHLICSSFHCPDLVAFWMEQPFICEHGSHFWDAVLPDVGWNAACLAQILGRCSAQCIARTYEQYKYSRPDRAKSIACFRAARLQYIMHGVPFNPQQCGFVPFLAAEALELYHSGRVDRAALEASSTLFRQTIQDWRNKALAALLDNIVLYPVLANIILDY